MDPVPPEIEAIWNLAFAHFFNLLHYATSGPAT
jgi:hypothetical protein